MDADQFDEDFDRIVEGAFRADTPGVLYHYTTWSGAEGILTTRQFWFTAHHCTNDPVELKSADKAVVEVATHVQARLSGPARQLIDVLLTNYCRSKVTEVVPVFVACFSQARDSQSQWRAYADEGRGLCLGIRVLDEAMPDNGGISCSLFRVDYAEGSWRQKIAAGFEDVCSEISILARRHNSPPRRAVELALNAMYRIAAYIAATAKQPHWSSEEEWRQVAIERTGFTVQRYERETRGKTIQYIKVFVRQPGRPLAVNEIIIGPNQDVESARMRLQGLLTDAGYPYEYAELPCIAASSVSFTS